jgi:D-glycero-D-manno-heptose 1,7-bisphosphate phosphatase
VKRNQVGIFFDRDGTINVDLDYLSDPDNLQLLPGAAQAIHEANEFGVRVFVITNQSGVARGLYSESDVVAVNARLQAVLRKQGAFIDAVYYCPHHPTYGNPPYRKDCNCRKPKPGMIEQARDEYGINLHESFVVGDKCTDVQAGKRAGCGTVLVLTGYGSTEVEDCGKDAAVDHVADTIYDAWRHIRARIEERSHG